MKKEKTVKTYKRRTKTGKVVTVRQHTAKYDAADKAKKSTKKKKGAGSELKEKFKKFIAKLMDKELPEDKVEKEGIEDEKPKKKEKIRPVGTGTNGPEPKKSKEKELTGTEALKKRNSKTASKTKETSAKRGEVKTPIAKSPKKAKSEASSTGSKDLKSQVKKLVEGLKGSSMTTYNKPARVISRKDGSVETNALDVSMWESLRKAGWKNIDKVTVVGGSSNYVSPDGKYHAVVGMNKTTISPVRGKVTGHSWDSVLESLMGKDY